jgi:hypothetical protein
MAPSTFEILAEEKRRAEHNFVEFATGVEFMTQEGNSASDLTLLVERLMDGLDKRSQELARVTHKPRLPGWVLAILGSLIVTLIGGFITATQFYATANMRITLLENRTQSIDQLNSLNVKVEALSGTVTRMEARFNEMMDSRREKLP